MTRAAWPLAGRQAPGRPFVQKPTGRRLGAQPAELRRLSLLFLPGKLPIGGPADAPRWEPVSPGPRQWGSVAAGETALSQPENPHSSFLMSPSGLAQGDSSPRPDCPPGRAAVPTVRGQRRRQLWYGQKCPSPTGRGLTATHLLTAAPPAGHSDRTGDEAPLSGRVLLPLPSLSWSETGIT